MKQLKYITLFALAYILFATVSCKKNESDFLTVPEAAAHFVGPSTQVYFINSSTTGPYHVVIGTTDVSTSDRTVSYTISSNSAVKGVHYTLASNVNTVTIPAGQATANI